MPDTAGVRARGGLPGAAGVRAVGLECQGAMWGEKRSSQSASGFNLFAAGSCRPRQRVLGDTGGQAEVPLRYDESHLLIEHQP